MDFCVQFNKTVNTCFCFVIRKFIYINIFDMEVIYLQMSLFKVLKNGSATTDFPSIIVEKYFHLVIST